MKKIIPSNFLDVIIPDDIGAKWEEEYNTPFIHGDTPLDMLNRKAKLMGWTPYDIEDDQ